MFPVVALSKNCIDYYYSDALTGKCILLPSYAPIFVVDACLPYIYTRERTIQCDRSNLYHFFSSMLRK